MWRGWRGRQHRIRRVRLPPPSLSPASKKSRQGHDMMNYDDSYISNLQQPSDLIYRR